MKYKVLPGCVTAKIVNTHQKEIMKFLPGSDEPYVQSNREWQDFESNNPALPLTTNLPEGELFEGDEVDAVIKKGGVIEVYKAIPLYGIEKLGWKQITVIQPASKENLPAETVKTVEEIAEEKYPTNIGMMENAVNKCKQEGFIAGYNANQSEESIVGIIEAYASESGSDTILIICNDLLTKLKK